MVMMQANTDIKKEIESKGIRYYQLAYAMGISKYTLSTWLQTPLSEQRMERIQKALAELTAE